MNPNVEQTLARLLQAGEIDAVRASLILEGQLPLPAYLALIDSANSRDISPLDKRQRATAIRAIVGQRRLDEINLHELYEASRPDVTGWTPTTSTHYLELTVAEITRYAKQHPGAMPHVDRFIRLGLKLTEEVTPRKLAFFAHVAGKVGWSAKQKQAARSAIRSLASGGESLHDFDLDAVLRQPGPRGPKSLVTQVATGIALRNPGAMPNVDRYIERTWRESAAPAYGVKPTSKEVGLRKMLDFVGNLHTKGEVSDSQAWWLRDAAAAYLRRPRIGGRRPEIELHSLVPGRTFAVTRLGQVDNPERRLARVNGVADAPPDTFERLVYAYARAHPGEMPGVDEWLRGADASLTGPPLTRSAAAAQVSITAENLRSQAAQLAPASLRARLLVAQARDCELRHETLTTIRDEEKRQRGPGDLGSPGAITGRHPSSPSDQGSAAKEPRPSRTFRLGRRTEAAPGEVGADIESPQDTSATRSGRGTHHPVSAGPVSAGPPSQEGTLLAPALAAPGVAAPTPGPGHRILAATPRTFGPLPQTRADQRVGATQATPATATRPGGRVVAAEQPAQATLRSPRPTAVLMAPGRVGPPESPGEVAQPDRPALVVDEKRSSAALPGPEGNPDSSSTTGRATRSPGRMGR